MIATVENLAILVAAVVFVLSLVVVVHEMGHFLVARALGVSVDRFSIGFGKAIAHWTDRAGVEWRLGWIPLGGYVRFTGDKDASSAPPDAAAIAAMAAEAEAAGDPERARALFHTKPVWVRALVVAAGPCANFVLAIALFAVLLGALGETTLAAKVGGLDPTGPAAKAGFKVGDLVVSADGHAISDWTDFKQFVSLRSGEPVTFGVDRDGRRLDLTATPERKAQVDPLTHAVFRLGYMGIESSLNRADLTRRHYGPVQAVEAGSARAWDIVHTTVFYLWRIAQGRESGDQLGGPVRIASIADAVAKAGAANAPNLVDKVLGATTGLLYLAAVMSVGIGFMNLLPIPVLDGGHLVFYAYEALARRPMAAQVQNVGQRVGLALLLAFMLFATWNDLLRLNLFKFLGGLFS